MSRTLGPFDPPGSRAPTVVLPDHLRPVPPPPVPDRDSEPTSRRTRPSWRRRRRLAIAGAAALIIIAVVAGLVARSVVGDGRDHAAELAAAIALEDGVRPLVSDWVDELGEVTSVVVKRTADPEPAVAHLLAPAGEDRPRVSVVSDPATVDITIDGLLADGRPYEIYMPEGRYVSLGTVGADGQYLEVMGRGMTIVDLLAVIADVTVDLTAIERLPDGWVELGSAPVPPWHHGFGTYYTFEGGRRLGMTVEQASPGRAALTAFAPTEAVDLGTDGWAYRHRPPDSQVWFERGDTVVHLTGDFSDTEFLLVIHSLRDMRPGEHPLSDPDPYPF